MRTLSGARNPWVIVGFLWLTFLLNYIDRQMIFSIFPLLRRELGFSDTQLGLIGSLFIWSYVICMPLSGRLTDILPRHRLILSSIVLWSFATLGTGLSHSAIAILFWRSMMGITEGLYLPSAVKLIALLHSGATRGRALAVHGTAQVFGIVTGGWFGGWAADRGIWRIGFFSLAATGIAYAFVLAWVLRGLPKPILTSDAAERVPMRLVKSRCYWALLSAFMVFGILLWVLYSWLPSFIYDRYGLNMAQSGVVATLFLQVSSGVGLLVGGAFADWCVKRVRAGRFYIIAAGFFFCAPCAWLTVKVHSLLLLKISAAGFGLFAGLLIMNVFAATYDVVPKNNYGFAIGVMNSLPGFLSGTAILMGGVLRQTLGIEGLMFWAALVTMLMAVNLAVVTALNFKREHARVGET